MIPEAFIQELLARADVVEIVGRYVQLKKGGANFGGLCPFHGEKSPSFTVSPSKQFFHCFGCGKNGNAIGFLMEHAGMTFVEAVTDLAGQFGMQVPQDRPPADQERAKEQQRRRATLTEVLERAAAAYRKHLRAAPAAVAYLQGRGVSGEVARLYGLGYAPEGWRTLASVFPEYAQQQLVDAGLVIEGDEDKRYDRFRDRVMFPIRNVKGECIGFGGRVLGEGTPKYLNSPETPVFSKGRELYGLYEARAALREAGYVLVTEGYMDVVALAQHGFANSVATLGTACTADHLAKLFRFTDNVVFSFDGDAAGRRAARKALEGALQFATDVRTVKFLFLPSQHDPDSFVREHGPEGFSGFIEAAVPLSRFLVDVAREDCDLAAAEGRARMLANAKPLWLQLPAGALAHQVLIEISALARMDPITLADLWGAASRGQGAAPAARIAAAGAGHAMPAARLDRVLQIVLGDSQAWGWLSNDAQALLCALPAPHGPLFSWLDAQYVEHGPQDRQALAAALAGHEEAGYAFQQVTAMPRGLESDPGELQALLAGQRAL